MQDQPRQAPTPRKRKNGEYLLRCTSDQHAKCMKTKFRDFSHLKSHVGSMHFEWRCTGCKQQFRTRGSLVKHVSDKSRQAPQLCDEKQILRVDQSLVTLTKSLLFKVEFDVDKAHVRLAKRPKTVPSVDSLEVGMDARHFVSQPLFSPAAKMSSRFPRRRCVANTNMSPAKSTASSCGDMLMRTPSPDNGLDNQQTQSLASHPLRLVSNFLRMRKPSGPSRAQQPNLLSRVFGRTDGGLPSIEENPDYSLPPKPIAAALINAKPPLLLETASPDRRSNFSFSSPTLPIVARPERCVAKRTIAPPLSSTQYAGQRSTTNIGYVTDIQARNELFEQVGKFHEVLATKLTSINSSKSSQELMGIRRNSLLRSAAELIQELGKL